jgi:hypothetical protein
VPDVTLHSAAWLTSWKMAMLFTPGFTSMPVPSLAARARNSRNYAFELDNTRSVCAAYTKFDAHCSNIVMTHDVGGVS